VTGHGLAYRETRFPIGLEIFLSSTALWLTLVSTQPSVQFVPGDLVLVLSRWGVNCFQLVTKNKKEWSAALPSPIRLHGVVLQQPTDVFASLLPSALLFTLISGPVVVRAWWRVLRTHGQALAANVLSRHLRTTDKVWSSIWAWEGPLATCHRNVAHNFLNVGFYEHDF
jgi:hypothetical protein